jgi:hypothetical protein
MSFSEPLRGELLDKKFLVPTDNACSITVGENLFEVHLVISTGSKPRHYYTDEYGELNPVDEDLLRQYRIDFSPLVRLIHDGLSCSGQIDEVRPGKFWKIGAAGQQSREVHLARMWESDAEVQKAVADTKKGSLIFYIGRKPGSFQRDDSLVYAVDTLIYFYDDGIEFDAQAVFNNIKGMTATKPRPRGKKPYGLQKNYQAQVETQLWIWFDEKLRIAKDIDAGNKVDKAAWARVNHTFKNQRELADCIEIRQDALTRAKDAWKKTPGGFGSLFLAIIEEFIRKPSKNKSSEMAQVDKLNDFYKRYGSKIDGIRRERENCN